MDKIYATLIIKGEKTFKDVPISLKEQVKDILKNRGYEALIEED